MRITKLLETKKELAMVFIIYLLTKCTNNWILQKKKTGIVCTKPQAVVGAAQAYP